MAVRNMMVALLLALSLVCAMGARQLPGSVIPSHAGMVDVASTSRILLQKTDPKTPKDPKDPKESEGAEAAFERIKSDKGDDDAATDDGDGKKH